MKEDASLQIISKGDTSSEPVLSFCIPTYNMRAFVAEALDSIISQAAPNIEIVISDNASTDGTEEVVRRYRDAGCWIVYHRSEKNFGFQRNLLKTVEFARGRWCWFMGDDALTEGALKRVLALLEAHPRLGGASLQVSDFDETLKNRVEFPQRTNRPLPTDQVFENGAAAASAIGYHIGYISAQVFRRDLWQKAIAEVDLSPYPGFPQNYIIYQIADLAPGWAWVAESCVKWRGHGNPLSMGADNVGVHVDLVTDEVPRIYAALFGKFSKPYFDTFGRAIPTLLVYVVVFAKSNSFSAGFYWRLLRAWTPNFWMFPAYWGKVVLPVLLPKWILFAMRNLLHRMRARSESGKTEVEIP